MSETTLSFTCDKCGMTSTDRRSFFFSHPFMPPVCDSESACKRRQKRDDIAAGRHFANVFNPIPVIQAFGLVNTLVAAIVVVCAIFMIAVAYTCLAFLWGF